MVEENLMLFKAAYEKQIDQDLIIVSMIIEIVDWVDDFLINN